MTTDDWISAYLDGELDAQDRALFERRMQADAQLAARVASFQRQDDRLAEALAVKDVDEELLRRLGLGHSPAASLQPPRAANDDQPFAWLSGRRSWMAGGAVAAALVLAVSLYAPQPAADGWQTSQEFQTAMSQTRSGDSVQIGERRLLPVLSMAQRNGGFCREFLVEGGTAPARGVACQQQGSWTVLALAQASGTNARSSDYRTASGPGDASIDQAIARYAEGDALSAMEEQQAIATRWRRLVRPVE